jgi:hypothetical protein
MRGVVVKVLVCCESLLFFFLVIEHTSTGSPSETFIEDEFHRGSRLEPLPDDRVASLIDDESWRLRVRRSRWLPAPLLSVPAAMPRTPETHS